MEYTKTENCAECTHCKLRLEDNFNLTPGGMLLNTKYYCSNKESESFEQTFGVLNNLMTTETIDARRTYVCESFDSKSLTV